MPDRPSNCRRRVVQVVGAVLLVGGALAVAGWASARRGLGRSSAAPAAAPGGGAIVLRDVTATTGIDFVHFHGGSGNRYIVEMVCAGLATFDYNGDGLVDIYFAQGGQLRGTHVSPAPRDALYRNEGELRFTNVSDEAGIFETGHSLGVTVGDYNGDGHPDLFVNNYGPDVLYRNNGNGTFTDVTEEAGVAGGDRVGAGAAFFDMEHDGDLDLWVGNYVRFNYSEHVTRVLRGYPQYPSPRDHGPDIDTLYRNNGDGTFTDVTRQSGVAEHAGTSMGLVAADFDHDGDTDVFVCNDLHANFFWRNDGHGHFTEVGLENGTAVNLYGMENGSMGADCGDFDNDGRLDIFMTDYQGELPVLYRNLGNGLFEDATLKTGAGAGTFQHVKWGTGLVDFDNDGDRDLYIACGHLQDLIDKIDPTTSYRAANVLLMNTGSKFVDDSAASGDGMAVKRASRGAAFDDLDNDGDIDAVVLNINDPPTVLRNDSPRGNHWLDVQLRGTKMNLDGVGARIKVVGGDLTQIAEVHAGRGYQSHYGTRLHFGLGRRTAIDRVEVEWPGGGRDVVRDAAVDRLLVIQQSAAAEDAVRE